jgi:hypothetical protein
MFFIFKQVSFQVMVFLLDGMEVVDGIEVDQE